MCPLSKQIKYIKSLKQALQDKTHRLESSLNAKDKNSILKKEIENIKSENKQLKLNVEYLETLLSDHQELIVYDTNKNTYKNNIVECCMNLTNLNVATRHISAVIREVCVMCGKVPNKLPLRQTVDNFVDRKLVLSQKQLGSVLKDKENTTIYTDETRKYGHTYESYLISDKENVSYLLGLREMENKSGQCTLDTMKEILHDITTLSEQEDTTVGKKILANIKNTMSDRASTEKCFNKLLQEYRQTILPDVIDNYSNLTQDAQSVVGQTNNFFCGLHLLVGIADVCEEAINKFEIVYLDETIIGSAQNLQLKRYHRAESGTLRLLRTCSKSFANGGR